MTRFILSLMALLLPVAFACSPQPCKTCINVSGKFTESTESRTVDCKSGRFLLSGDWSSEITVSQAGPNLTLNGTRLTGTLHEDQSALFGPIPGVATPVDGTGAPDPEGTPEPGKVYLTGWFLGSGDSASFQGTYVFLQDVDNCEIDTPTKWHR